MDELIKQFEASFPGWDWLLRSNNKENADRGKYFCNLSDFAFRADNNFEGQSFKAFADTPEQAFQEAFIQFIANVERAS